LNEEVEEEVELSFEDASPVFPTVSSSRAESLDISGLQPFTKILTSFLDNTTSNPPVVNHPVPNLPFQQQPHNPVPPVMAQPTFPFPLPSLITNANLKNKPPIALSKFYGLATEDPDTFLFEFDILFHSFDYNTDAHKLKLFPATLKESALRWFMGLGANVAVNWDEMQALFLEKYKEYCKASGTRGDDIFRISQKEEETLEGYVS
jgi:hypothetical protein